MMWEHGWALFWSASLMVQVCGTAIACWQWWQATIPGWRWFWCAFSVNWFFTLSHQITWGLWGEDLATMAGCAQGVFKLLAMGAELFVMLLARQVELTSAGTRQTLQDALHPQDVPHDP